MDTQLPLVFAAIGLGILAILVLQRNRSQRELQNRVRDLTVLADAERILLTGSPDINHVAERIFQEASRMVDTSAFQLGLFEAGRFRLLYGTQDSSRIPNSSLELDSDEQGLLRWLREQRQPLLVSDFQQETDGLPARPPGREAASVRSAVYVPLVAHEEAVGAILVQSRRPRAFTQGHLRLLAALAGVAAASLSQARLLDEALRRARHQELLGKVSQQIRAIQPLPDLYRQVVSQVKDAFGFQAVSIYELEDSGPGSLAAPGGSATAFGGVRPPEQEGVLVLRATSSPAFEPGVHIAPAEGTVGQAALRNQAVIALRGEPRGEPLPDQVEASLAVPLPIENRVIGVLEIQSSERTEFGPDFVEAIELLAGHLAIAVLETRTYESERRRSKQLEAVAEASRVATSILDPDQLVEQVLSLTSTRLGQERIRLFVRQGDQVVLRAGRSRMAPLSYPLEGAGLIAFVARTGQPVLVHDVQNDGRYLPAPGWEDTVSEMAIPLVFGDRVLGVLDLQSKVAGAFAAEDLQMVQAFAAMLAVALRNAQLFSREREAAWLSASLLRVAETASHPGDPDEALTGILRLVPALVERPKALLWRPVWESGNLLPVAAAGLSLEETQAFQRTRPSLSALCPPALLDANELAWPAEWTCPPPPEILAFLHPPLLQVLPLRYAGHLLGLLTVPARAQPSDSLPGTETRERSLLLGLVHQLAMVMEAKRLKVELEAARRLEREMEVAREIQVSFLPKELPQVEGWQVSASWESAREVGGDFYDFFALPAAEEGGGIPQPRWGVVIADVADKGVPAALFMALSRTLFRAVAISRVDPAGTLARVNDLLFTDASAELFVTAFYAVWEPDSGRITYANAGHNPPLLILSGGRSRWLPEHGVALGVVKGSAYRTRSLHMRPGETLVLYTDGLLDAENSEHQAFGPNGLQSSALQSGSSSAQEIVASITRALSAHVLTEEPFDDMTLVVLRRLLRESPGARTSSRAPDRRWPDSRGVRGARSGGKQRAR